MFYRAANICILKSWRFSSPVGEICKITCNILDINFPQSRRLSNLYAKIGSFSGSLLQDQGKVGKSVFQGIHKVLVSALDIENTPDVVEVFHTRSGSLSHKGWKKICKILI